MGDIVLDHNSYTIGTQLLQSKNTHDQYTVYTLHDKHKKNNNDKNAMFTTFLCNINVHIVQ